MVGPGPLLGKCAVHFVYIEQDDAWILQHIQPFALMRGVHIKTQIDEARGLIPKIHCFSSFLGFFCVTLV